VKSDDPVPVLISALSGSGFPFQTAVAAEIRATKLFQVDEEVAWNSCDGSTRFLDLVASNERVRICIECKALRNDNLVFLLPKDTRQPPTNRVKRLPESPLKVATLGNS
jgi:hypothetical protein